MDHAALWASGRASSSSAVNSIATPPAVSFSTGLAAATDELEKPNKQNRYEVNKFHRFSDFRFGPVIPRGLQVADSIQVCRISKGRTTHPCSGAIWSPEWITTRRSDPNSIAFTCREDGARFEILGNSTRSSPRGWMDRIGALILPK
jgi:hypothetical protein